MNPSTSLNPSELTSPDCLTTEEISALLPALDDVIKWAKQVQEYALNQALKGAKFPGFKVVAGRSLRKFTDVRQVVDTLIGEGYDEAVLYERKFIALPQVEALVGKKNFETLLGRFIDKPVGKPTLVPETDKRSEYNLTSAAAEDFGG